MGIALSCQLFCSIKVLLILLVSRISRAREEARQLDTANPPQTSTTHSTPPLAPPPSPSVSYPQTTQTSRSAYQTQTAPPPPVPQRARPGSAHTTVNFISSFPFFSSTQTRKQRKSTHACSKLKPHKLGCSIRIPNLILHRPLRPARPKP